MTRFATAMNAWNTADFTAAIKAELELLGPHGLPLQQGLTRGSQVTDSPVSAVIISATEEADSVRVRAGIFYSGIIAGCSCADDPTPVDETTEYCELLVVIQKETLEACIVPYRD